MELPTDKLREERETGRAEGRIEGRAEGRMEGRAEGDVFRLISQVRRKMLRRKPFDEICKELEEEAKHIRPICEAFLRKGLDCPEEEIHKEL